MNDKIINFQQRRQLEQAIAAFADAVNERQLIEAARRIVLEFPGDAVLAALLKHLDTQDGQIRGGLGHVATLLPQEEVVGALRTVAGGRQFSALARTTAVTLAARFLGVEFPAALTEDLAGSNDAAFQSLLQALNEGKRNRHILLEYVEQMRGFGEEIALLVLEALGRVPPVDQVELLRLIAQDVRPAVARAALGALDGLIMGEAATQAVRALHTLQFTLPPAQATLAERTLRKARMAGHRYAAPSAAGWRALLSPAEPNGVQSVWLVQMPPAADESGVLLGFSLHLEAGLLRFFGSERVDGSVLPPPQPLGQIQAIYDDSGRRNIVLEAPFDYGRWLVQTALRAQLAATPDQPLPGEYQLYNDRIWAFAPPQVDAAIEQIWQATTASVDLTELESTTGTLFAHPAMSHWRLTSQAILKATPATARPDPTLPLAETVTALLREIARWPESAALAPALARGLRGQAAWFHLAGEQELADRALTLAQAMPQLSPAQNPVLAQMLAAGLQQKK
jgi:hypothetical protein